MSSDAGVFFKIWAVDNVVYGPVELPILVNWVKEERVTPDTWIYLEQKDEWHKAACVPELKMFFGKGASNLHARVDSPTHSHLPINDLQPSSLRRIKIFAGMSDEQLTRFLQYMEVRNARQFTTIVRQGDPGDAMYLVLDGEVRVRLMIQGKETLLTTLAAGEFFGEISLFDHGPRSADVVVNQSAVLLKISASAFQRLSSEAPELATPFLLAIGRTLTGRIRADNKRFRDYVSISRAAGQPS